MHFHLGLQLYWRISRLYGLRLRRVLEYVENCKLPLKAQTQKQFDKRHMQ
jgi:hypothetical protein